MPSPSVTYSFSNGTTSDATQVNTNFTDIINALTDGLKDLVVSSISLTTLTVSGVATFNGNVVLGNASGDTITVTGTPTFSTAITILATTNQIVLGTTNTVTISCIAPAASRTYTLGDAGGAANFVLSSGALNSGRVAYVTTNGILVDSANFTFNGTTLTAHTLTVSTGTLTANSLVDISGSSAGQIKFPASQNSSSDSNTLDDYEEGTWTPSLEFAGAATGMTYQTNGRQGYYTKIGNLITVTVWIELTNKGSSTGQALINGLPYNQKNSTNMYCTGFSPIYGNMSSLSDGWGGYTNPNSGQIILHYGGAAGSAALTHANFTNSSAFSLSVTYHTA